MVVSRWRDESPLLADLQALKTEQFNCVRHRTSRILSPGVNDDRPRVAAYSPLASSNPSLRPAAPARSSSLTSHSAIAAGVMRR